MGVLIRLFEDAAKTVPSDLSEATVTAQVRATSEASAVLADFDVAVTGNEISLVLTPAKSRSLPAAAVYDCQVDWQGDDVNVQTVLAGTLTVSPDVTRSGLT
jgi:hypothetical protein